MTQRGGNAYDLDRHATLLDELAFALRSLDDLEAEHAGGEVTDATYERLHAAYTVRAADATRGIQEVTARRPVVPARRRRTKVIASLLLAVMVIAVAISLHAGSRTRQPGETITGDSAPTPADTAGDPAGDPEGDAAGRQASLDAVAEKALVRGDLTGALRGYIAALQADPRDVEALTYAGWLGFLAGSPHKAVPLLEVAVRTDPSYPDAHAFLGIVLLRSHQQQAAAMAQLRQYLRLVPSGQMSQQVRRVLQVATKSSRTRGQPAR